MATALRVGVAVVIAASAVATPPVAVAGAIVLVNRIAAFAPGVVVPVVVIRERRRSERECEQGRGSSGAESSELNARHCEFLLRIATLLFGPAFSRRGRVATPRPSWLGLV